MISDHCRNSKLKWIYWHPNMISGPLPVLHYFSFTKIWTKALPREKVWLKRFISNQNYLDKLRIVQREVRIQNFEVNDDSYLDRLKIDRRWRHSFFEWNGFPSKLLLNLSEWFLDRKWLKIHQLLHILLRVGWTIDFFFIFFNFLKVFWAKNISF